MKIFVALLVALFVGCAVSALVEPAVLEPVEFRSVESLEIPEDLKRDSWSLYVSPISGAAGTTITCTYSSTTVGGTWIGLFRAGSSSTSVFKYLPNGSGSLTLSTAGLAAGSYNIHLVYNSYIRVTVRYTITGGGSSSSTSGNPTTSNPTSSNPTSSSTTSNPSGDAGTWLSEHNRRRAGIVPGLGWSNKLAASAQAWANTMASQCRMYHSGKYGVGENVAYGYGSIAAVMTAWADNEKQYYRNGQCVGGTCGHYTQVMWKSTTQVGCAKAYCGSTPYYVCQYIRPGNCNGYNFMQDNSPCPYFSDASL